MLTFSSRNPDHAPHDGDRVRDDDHRDQAPDSRSLLSVVQLVHC